MVSELTSMPVQYNKAIVGRNAFAHESGIHQDGFLKGRATYEIMEPAWIGLSESLLPLGPRSGRAALKSRMEKLGFTVTDEQLPVLFDAFKHLADQQKRVEDDDLKRLYEQALMKA
jgi:2-isopropylmalate synthase